MSDVHAVARDQLRAFIERIERLESEKKSIADDIKDVYGEAKGTGFDTKVLRKLISIRKQDREERMEQEAILDMYMIALGMVDEPAGYDEPRQSEPVERQPAVALRSDSGLNIVTKHTEITASPETANASLANGPCEAVSERTAGEVYRDGADLPTNSELLGGFPVAAAETNAEETGGVDADKIEYPKPRLEKEKIAATLSDQPGEGGADEVSGIASRERDLPTSNTGEGAANTALPAKPKVSFRPNCQHPENCASGTRDHCWSCRRAMQKSEEMA